MKKRSIRMLSLLMAGFMLVSSFDMTAMAAENPVEIVAEETTNETGNGVISEEKTEEPAVETKEEVSQEVPAEIPEEIPEEIVEEAPVEEPIVTPDLEKKEYDYEAIQNGNNASEYIPLEEVTPEMTGGDPQWYKANGYYDDDYCDGDSELELNGAIVHQRTDGYMFGVDVSKWQGNIDWAAAKNAGVKFAIIRAAGYKNGQLYTDDYFAKNMQGASEQGIHVGVYVYSLASNESIARNEADYICNLVKDYNLALPVYIDYEDASIKKLNNGTSVCNAFCDRVAEKGRTAGVYASFSLFKEGKINASSITEKYYIWLARYNDYALSDNVSIDYRCWQYTSKGSVSGISGNVDCDFWYGPVVADNRRSITYVLNGTKDVKITNPNKRLFYEQGYTEYTLLDLENTAGWIFGGWYTDKYYKNPITEITKKTRGNLTLYAKWGIDVNLNLDGGYLDGDITRIEMAPDATLYKNIKEKDAYGKAQKDISALTPVKANCDFEYWYYYDADKKTETKITADSALVKKTNHTLYAKWKKKYTMPAPIPSIASGEKVDYGTELSFSSDVLNPVFYYTIGTSSNPPATPTTESTLYTDPIEIKGDCVIKVIATRDDYLDSPVSTFTYTINDNSEYYGEVLLEDLPGTSAMSLADRVALIPDTFWTPDIPDVTYTGKALKPEFNVYYGKKKLTAKTEYAVTYKNNINAGTATAVITGKGNYAGSFSREFTIVPADITEDIASLDSIVYVSNTGKAQSPVIKLYHGKKKLLVNKEYTLTWKNELGQDNKGCKAAGTTVDVTVTGIKNYTGTGSFKFAVAPQGKVLISKIPVSPIKSQPYTGSAIRPEVVVKNGYDVSEGKDYTLTYKDNVEIGVATIVMEAAAGSTSLVGKREITFKITGTPISKAKVTGLITKFEYDGSNKEQGDAVLSCKGEDLTRGKDYEVEYQNNKEIGTATVIYTGKGAYYGTMKKTYKITGIAMSKVKVEDIETNLPFRGTAYEQAGPVDDNSKSGNVFLHYVDVKNEIDKPLKKGEDFSVSYLKNTNAGTATIIFKGMGHYTGTIKKSFKITPYNLSTDDRSAISISFVDKDRIEFTKGGTCPEILVAYKNADGSVSELIKGKDYTVKYYANKAVTDEYTLVKPSVSITGKGNFSKSSDKKEFSIVKADISKAYITVTDPKYTGKVKNYKTTVTITDPVTNKKLVAGTDYEKDFVYSYTEATIVSRTINGARKYVNVAAGDPVLDDDIMSKSACTNLTVVVTGKNGYKNTISEKYELAKNTIAGAKVTIPSQAYTGKEIRPAKSSYTVTLGTGTNQVTLSPSDFEIVAGSYKNNIKKGRASVRIHGTGRVYSGYTTAYFTITNKSLNNTVIYKSNPRKSDAKIKGTMPDTITAINAKLRANAYVYDGYTFAGWNTEPNGTGYSYKNKEAFTIKDGRTTSGGKVTLYAQWTPTTYTIRYEINGGVKIGTYPTTYNTEMTFSLDSYVPQKSGKTFDGWYRTKDFKEGTKITTVNEVTGNLTVYAKWK